MAHFDPAHCLEFIEGPVLNGAGGRDAGMGGVSPVGWVV